MIKNKFSQLVFFIFILFACSLLTAVAFGAGGIAMKSFVYLIYGSDFDAIDVFLFFCKKGAVVGVVAVLSASLLVLYKNKGG
ncbi:hypothetical protein ACW5WQ_03075 [Aeromonas rivuli]|uniref:hypothetical protein n=1 Tax=Aeromonas rivuli TaxID=648794 RepID=UPI0005A6CC6F|nr:hypothetical protein [Aeromonas rivuli]